MPPARTPCDSAGPADAPRRKPTARRAIPPARAQRFRAAPPRVPSRIRSLFYESSGPNPQSGLRNQKSPGDCPIWPNRVGGKCRAEKAMAALKRLSVPLSRVRRGGELCEVSSLDLVPGGIVGLEACNFIAADGRLLESADHKTHISCVDRPVRTNIRRSIAATSDQPGELPLGDRRNMVHRGSALKSAADRQNKMPHSLPRAPSFSRECAGIFGSALLLRSVNARLYTI